MTLRLGREPRHYPRTVRPTAGETTPFQSALSADALQGGVVSGTGKALDRLANGFLDVAEDMFPVIEIDAGRPVELVVSRGAALRLRGEGPARRPG